MPLPDRKKKVLLAVKKNVDRLNRGKTTDD